MSVTELVDWHTRRKDEVPPAGSSDDGSRDRTLPGRHKWRPGDPVALRPTSLPPLPAPPIVPTETQAGQE